MKDEGLDKKLAELTQAVFPWRRQTLALYPDRVELTVKGPLDRYRMPFYLHAIKEYPDRMIYVRWPRLVAGVALLAAAAVLAWAPEPLRHRGGAIVLAALGGTWLALQVAALRRRIVYFYRAADSSAKPHLVPQLYVDPAKPSKADVERFLDVVAATHRRHMTKLREEMQGPPPLYTRELERFAELQELEVVTTEEYDCIREKLLNIKKRRIGF